MDVIEQSCRSAIAAFVTEKFEKGEARPHVFNQFWLQFSKLAAGAEVIKQQLEARTGSREGPLPLGLLQAHPEAFGIGVDCAFLNELTTKAASAEKSYEIDVAGLILVLLVIHLNEPAAAEDLHRDVRTMLACLEAACTHFNSARKGRLDKREMTEALGYEAAKAHCKGGRGGRTGSRLAHRLFEGLDWENDNTITFEAFVRGVLRLVQDEFGEDDDEEEGEGMSRAATASGLVSGGATDLLATGASADGRTSLTSTGGGVAAAGAGTSAGAIPVASGN